MLELGDPRELFSHTFSLWGFILLLPVIETLDPNPKLGGLSRDHPGPHREEELVETTCLNFLPLTLSQTGKKNPKYFVKIKIIFY